MNYTQNDHIKAILTRYTEYQAEQTYLNGLAKEVAHGNMRKHFELLGSVAETCVLRNDLIEESETVLGVAPRHVDHETIHVIETHDDAMQLMTSLVEDGSIESDDAYLANLMQQLQHTLLRNVFQQHVDDHRPPRR